MVAVTGRGIGYVRVSTDLQDTSRQHKSINLWLQRHQLAPITILEDTGRRHQPEKRKDFQELLRLVQTKQVDWVVLDSQDRIGFGHPHQWGHLCWEFTKAGVQLWSATEDRCLNSDKIGDIIISDVGAINSRQEMTQKASRDIGKKREMALKGEWVGGWIPYGCDVACLDSAGAERWRVIITGKWQRLKQYTDGRTETWEGMNNFPRDRMQGDRLVLVPTAMKERIKTLSDIFQWWVNESLAMNAIAKRLNKMENHHPHGPWYGILIKGILQNPAAIGKPAWNKNASGLYAELCDGQVSTEPPRKGPNQAKVARRRPRSEWITPDKQLFPPLVPVKLFEQAQEKLDGLEKRARAPKSERLWLSGLLYCAKCKKPMTGWFYKKMRGCPASYACSTYRMYGSANKFGCRHHRVTATQIEALVDQYLKEVGEDIEVLVNTELESLLTLRREKSKRLSRVIEEMRGYLIRHLDEAAECEIAGETRIYHMGDHKLEIPGCKEDDLRWTFNWLVGYREGSRKARREELTEKLRALYEKWDNLTGLARDWCQEEMQRVQSQLDSLGESVDLAKQYREAVRELSQVSLLVYRARREKALRCKAEALRKVLERVELSFSYFKAGSQTRSKLVKARFLPLVGEERTLQATSALEPD